MSSPQGDTDFFISYRGSNTAWAKWVNWVLRREGFSTVIMDEFKIGQTWTRQMRDSCQKCRRLVPLYSVDYWTSGPCTEEFDTYWSLAMGNLGEQFLIPLEVEPCTVPDIHAALLTKRLIGLSRDEAISAIQSAIRGIPATGSVISEPEPPFPVSPAAPAVEDWPDSPPATLKWPLADHDEARDAFAMLITRTSPFQLLAILGNSETGKSHLTKQFLNNASRYIPSCRCGRLDFKGTGGIDEALKDFVAHLGIAQPPATANLGDRLRHVLNSLATPTQPTLLILDTFEDVGDADRWVCGSLLPSLHRSPGLRVVIAGQKLPPCHGETWADDSKVLSLPVPSPAHWHDYAQSNGRPASLTTVTEVHQLAGGKASILAQLFGPVA